MIIDLLANCSIYNSVHKRMDEAFRYLQRGDIASIPEGTHLIDGENLFAIVREYETLDTANEEMEAHKKYIDIQYMIRGEELVGHALLGGQKVSKEYDPENDFMLYADAPAFFTKMAEGTFMVFFPSDLHMPCIKVNESATVRKVVIKVRI